MVKIFLIIFILIIIGCDNNNNNDIDFKKENAKKIISEYLVRSIEARNRGLDPNDFDYRTSAYVRGYRLLEAPNIVEKLKELPIILGARFVFNPEYKNRVLLLTWLEEGYETKGIIIKNENNEIIEYEIFKWDQKHKEYYGDSYARWMPVVVYFNVDDELKEHNKTTRLAEISIPEEFFKGEVKLGLLTDSGEKTDMIKTFISAGFLEEKTTNSQQ
jgi:hypothetical protein